MNRYIAAFAVALLWAINPAGAQEKTFTLTVSPQDLQVMSAGLDELPRKVSQPLVEKLQRQLVPQMQAAPAAPSVDLTPKDTKPN